MLSTPQIVQTSSQPSAVIHLTIPASEMPKQFGPAVAELMATLHAQRVEPVGAVFAHHLANPSETFNFELGVKVTAPVKATGRVYPGELPAARVARTIYSGPYEGLPAAWGEFTTWIKAQGYGQAENLWELYSFGPQSSPDSTTWKTELNRPIKA